MKTQLKTIRQSVLIQAPKERVWTVLFNDAYYKLWYSEFGENSKAETNWTEGSKALFTDNSNNGIAGVITENKLYETLTIEYRGRVVDGYEDYTSPQALAISGSKEIYALAEKNGFTFLAIACDMACEYVELMTVAWRNALQKIKILAED